MRLCGKRRANWIAGLLLAGGTAWAALVNTDFSQGLIHWKAAWPVSTIDGEALLTDAAAQHVYFFQAFLSGPETVTIEFDFRNELCPTNRPGTFRDSFYVSVYQVDHPGDFILEHDKFARAGGLMDLDAGGPFNVNGVVTDSPKGPGWWRFTGTWTNAHAYALVVFELYDLNLTPGDSAVRLDNVMVSP